MIEQQIAIEDVKSDLNSSKNEIQLLNKQNNSFLNEIKGSALFENKLIYHFY